MIPVFSCIPHCIYSTRLVDIEYKDDRTRLEGVRDPDLGLGLESGLRLGLG
jgi:hypothetical protein